MFPNSFRWQNATRFSGGGSVVVVGSGDVVAVCSGGVEVVDDALDGGVVDDEGTVVVVGDVVEAVDGAVVVCATAGDATSQNTTNMLIATLAINARRMRAS